MRINNGHRTLAATITIGLVGVLGIGGLVRSEPVVDAPVAQTPSGAVDTPQWLADVEDQAMDSSDVEGRTIDPASAGLVQEMLAGDRQSIPSHSGRPEIPLTQADIQAIESSGSLSVAPAAKADVNWGPDLASAAREAFRPMYEELLGSAMVDALHTLESEFGLGRRRSFSDPSSGGDSQNAGKVTHPESMSWERPGNRYDTQNRPRSSARSKDDQLMATDMVDSFIEELKPWLFAVFGLYAFGYMVKLWLDYSRLKAARRRKRHAMGTRHKRRRHRSRDKRVP